MTSQKYLLPILLTLGAQAQAQTDDAITLSQRCLSLATEDAVYGSARYSAMAGAASAVGNDISTIRENPAGLGLYTKNSEAIVTPTFSMNEGGEKRVNVANFGGVFLLGNNHKAEGYVSSALGVSYHRLKNYDCKLELDQAEFEESKQSGQWNVSCGLNFGNRQFYGIGIDIIRSKFDQSTTNSADDINSFQLKSLGWNLKLGGIWKLKEQLNVSASVQTPTRYNIEESARTNRYAPDGKINGENNYDNVEYHQWGPLKLGAGIGYYIGKNAQIDFDYSFQDFSAINVSNSYDYYNDVKEVLDDYMKSCHTMRLGFESAVGTNFKARAGAAFTTSPTDPPKEKDLEGKDIHQVVVFPHQSLYLCAGVGYQYNWLFADVAYVFKSQKADVFQQINANNRIAESTSLKNMDIMLSVGARF